MKRLYNFTMYFLFTLVFANEWIGIPSDVFIGITSVVMVLFLISSLSISRGFQFYVSILSLFIGHILIYTYGLSFSVWYKSITTGMGIPVLFVVIPMISYPILRGPYLASMEQLAGAKKNNPGRLFLLLTILYLMMAITLNIAVIPTIKKMIEKINFPNRFFSLICMTGSSCYMVFSPYDAIVNLILIYTGLSYLQYFLTGFLMVLFILGIALIFLFFNQPLIQSLKESLDQIKSQPVIYKPLFSLFAHILNMILLACLSNLLLPFSSPIYGIALILLGYSVFWCITLGFWGRLKQLFSGYSSNLLAYAGFLPFLISAGFIGTVFSQTPLKDEFIGLINQLSILPLYFEVQVLILFTILLSLCGIHMLIPVTAMAVSLSPEIIGLTQPGFALMLLTCWYNAMIISPFVPFIVVTADTLGVSPLKVSFAYNMGFRILMIIVSPIAVIGIDRLILFLFN